jgi:hypothetical protein
MTLFAVKFCGKYKVLSSTLDVVLFWISKKAIECVLPKSGLATTENEFSEDP